MLHFIFRARSIRSLILLLTFALALLTRAPVTAQTTVPVGPILFLVQANALQIRRLPSTGLVVHTALLTSSNEYIASGTQAQADAATALGATLRVLDPDTQGKVYFFAEADEDDSVEIVEQYATVLYQDPTELFVSVPAADEAAFVERVPAQGVEVYALPLTPYAPPEDIVTVAALPTQPQPLISSLVNAVSEDALYQRMLDLSGARTITVDGTSVTLTTSYTYSPVIRYTEQYIFNALKQMGYNPVYVPWSKSGASGKTIVADLPGTVHPERIWILDGHFDTTSENPYASAPGADDNASGVGSLLVIANLLRNQKFTDTIRFVGFSGEEQGMLGSQVYAAQLKQQGVQLQGVIDMDQFGYDGDNDHVFEIHSGTRSNSIELAKMFITANTLYHQGLIVELKDTTAARWSDHSSFWDQGFAAILAEENWFTDAPRGRDGTPCYHKVCDKMVTVNMNYVHRAARTALATLAHLAGIIDGPTPTPTNTLTLTPTLTPSRTLTPSLTPSPSLTFTPSLTPSPSLTPTSTFTPGPITCTESVANGGFEANANWSFGTTSRPPKYVTAQVHTGAQSLQMGIPPGITNAIAHSSARQLITLPASASSITLTYWERPGGGGDGTDYRELLFLNSSGVYSRTLDRNFAAGNNQWTRRTFDFTPYKGQSVYLYLNTYNNGAGSTMWNYVDDVSVQNCTASTPAPVTATPTASATSTSTPPPTATPTQSATPTVTSTSTVPPTATASPSATYTSSPTSTATETATLTSSPTPAPIDTPTPSPTATTSPTSTVTPSATLTPSMTVSPTPPPTNTPSPTNTPIPPTFTPTFTATATLTPPLTPTPANCVELLANGSFETDTAWQFGYTSRPAAYVATPVHSGARALRLGIPAGTANANSYSSARQVVVLPSNARAITLTYWERPGSGDASDYRETLLLLPAGSPRTLARAYGAGSNQWQPRTFDLTAYKGQTVTLYFNTYNSGTGSLAWNYLDDASVVACSGAP